MPLLLIWQQQIAAGYFLRVLRSSVWTTATVSVYRSGSWVEVTDISVYRSGVWTSAT